MFSSLVVDGMVFLSLTSVCRYPSISCQFLRSCRTFKKTDKYLSCWQASLLNPMGRAVLVNSVLDSLLVYFMSSL